MDGVGPPLNEADAQYQPSLQWVTGANRKTVVSPAWQGLVEMLNEKAKMFVEKQLKNPQVSQVNDE